jgi:sarcosine oxidase subunit beta
VPILHDATESYYLRPHPTGLLAGDGTEHVESDPDDWQREGDDTFVDAMETRFAHRLPDHATDIERAWAGLCTATPDEDPLLGEVADGLYIATGWHGHGFVRSPATGEAVAEEILDGEGIEAFDPTRFDGDEDFEIVEGMSIDED